MEVSSDSSIEHNKSIKQGNASVKDVWTLLQNEWPKYLVEVVVIVISISFSFWLERANENRRGRAEQLVLLNNLATDIEADIKSLEEVIKESKTIVGYCDTLIKMSSGKLDDLGSQRKFMNLYGSILPRPAFLVKNSTFLGAASTTKIEDMDLNRHLIEFYQYCDLIKKYEDDESSRVLNIFQPYLYTRLSAQAWHRNDMESLAADGSKFTKLIHDNVFQNVIDARKQDRDEIPVFYRHGLELAKSLTEEIKAVKQKL